MASSVETLIRKTVTKGVIKVAEFNRDRMTSDTPHPFLSGIHKPMTTEKTITDLKVTGSIPAELDGRYIRIGPNPAGPVKEASYHWFIGDGMVHGVKLKGGKAEWYRNRWIKSKAVTEALGLPPAPGPRNGLSDTVNTNVLGHAGETWAVVEAGGFPVRINEELETIAHDPFGGTLKNSFSAHPHLDPETGEMHAICYKGDVQDRIHHVVVGTSGKVIREESIPVKHGPMIHDCMITKSYVIILDLPVTFSMKTLIGGHQFPYAWNPDHKARVGLLARTAKGEEAIWCDIDPCFTFHPANAFDRADGVVVMDACVYSTMFAGGENKGPDTTDARFERWYIDPVAKKVERTVLDDSPQEFPRPNETLLGKSYRYAYTMALPKNADPAFLSQTQLYKHDLEAGTRQVHDFGDGHIPGEFVFVPAAGAKAEDEGWLMGYVVNTAEETTDLVILNAQDFEGRPQAVVHIPHRIPPGFHGNWVVA